MGYVSAFGWKFPSSNFPILSSFSRRNCRVFLLSSVKHFGSSKSGSQYYLGCGFIFFGSYTYLGKWSHLTNIFQKGWNHQLDRLQCLFFYCALPLLGALFGFKHVHLGSKIHASLRTLDPAMEGFEPAFRRVPGSPKWHQFWGSNDPKRDVNIFPSRFCTHFFLTSPCGEASLIFEYPSVGELTRRNYDKIWDEKIPDPCVLPKDPWMVYIYLHLPYEINQM